LNYSKSWSCFRCRWYIYWNSFWSKKR